MKPDYDKVCFVIMQFGKEGSEERRECDEIYEHIIKAAVQDSGLGLNCVKANDISQSGRIIDDVIRFCDASKFVIADLTHRNPNVFYELGIRHARAHRTILMAQSTESLPFDVIPERTIIYSKSTLTEANKAKNELTDYLKQMSLADDFEDSPVLRLIEGKSKPHQLSKSNDQGRQAVDKRHKQKVLTKAIAESRLKKRIAYIFAAMGLKEVTGFGAPSFFKPFCSWDGDTGMVLYLVMEPLEPDADKAAFLVEYAQSISELSKTLDKPYSSGRENALTVASQLISLNKVEKLLFVVPYVGDITGPATLYEALEFHYDKNVPAKKRVRFPMGPLGSFIRSDGNVHFEVWDNSKIKELEKHYHLIIDD